MNEHEIKALAQEQELIKRFEEMIDTREQYQYDLIKLHPSVDIAKRHQHNMTVDKIFDDLRSTLQELKESTL